MFIRDAIQRSHNINDYVNWGAGLLLIIVIVVAFTKKFHKSVEFQLQNLDQTSASKAGPNFSFKRFYRRRALGCV